LRAIVAGLIDINGPTHVTTCLAENFLTPFDARGALRVGARRRAAINR
jgi:hypothetical protein